MKAGLLILFCIVGSGLAASRWKRDLLQFDYMVSCVTKRDAVWDYNGYGCWCGKGGYGNPVDGTDQCCMVHDLCYRKLEENGNCSTTDLYFKRYNCHYCTDENENFITDCSRCGQVTVTCDSPTNTCEKALCECDREAVMCFLHEDFHDCYKNHWNWWYC